MKKTKILVVAVLAWWFAPPAMAQMQPGVYFGVSAGSGQNRDDCKGGSISGVFECDNKDTTWGVNLGYQFTPYFAAELGYGHIARTDILIFGQFKEWITANAWEVVGVGSLPIERLSVYVKAGGYYAKSKFATNFDAPEATEKNFGWTAGAGVRYDLWQHWALRAEYQRYNNVGGPDVGGTSDADVYRLSVLFKF
jgi:OOP family OmpA-OmpF porin